MSRRACQRTNTPCLVSSKLTGWQTRLSAVCQYSLGPLVMGHTPNDRSRSFPFLGIINPPSGPCPGADTAEHHTRWTCRSTVSYCTANTLHEAAQFPICCCSSICLSVLTKHLLGCQCVKEESKADKLRFTGPLCRTWHLTFSPAIKTALNVQ